jgi:uncharacterized protein YjbI with pentapeptide repeats
MAKRNTVRTAWWLAAILAGVVLGGTGMLLVRLRPYWVARYWGREADLRGVNLSNAVLPGVDLAGAELIRAKRCPRSDVEHDQCEGDPDL